MTKPSLKEMSEALGLSKATVSLVLNGRGDEKRIGKETQERILKFAKEHNYKANPLARSLSMGKSNTIGLIVPNIGDIFFSQIAMRTEKKAEKLGYHVIYSSTGESAEKESKIIESMLDRKVDGLIIASSEQNSNDILGLKESKFPFVIVSRNYPDIETNLVEMDEIGAITSAVELLIKNGRKRIAFITITLKLHGTEERKTGYLQTMAKHGLEVKDGYIQEVDHWHLEDSMPRAINALINHTDGVDAIVFATQLLTVSGIRVLKRNNISIPEQIAVVSYGCSNEFDLYTPSVSGVDLPTKQMGDAAVDLLIEAINSNSNEYKTIQIGTKLIIGKSCGS